MQRIGEEVHIDEDEARSGSTPHIVRYVLGISLALAIVALSAIWITGSLTHETNAGDKQPSTAEEAALSG